MQQAQEIERHKKEMAKLSNMLIHAQTETVEKVGGTTRRNIEEKHLYPKSRYSYQKVSIRH